MKKEKENNMNKQEMDILKCLYEKKYVNQRVLAEQTGHSLGIVNRYLNELQDAGYITDQMTCTNKAMEEFEIRKPQNAIILAAGFGMRMVPINTESPKGLLEINGEPLIERMIRQLHEVGISKIYVIVGFMKERYEYLIDKFNVELVVNPEYSTKNNLYSMKKILPFLSNSYIVPCDIWCDKNPFRRYELYSWYMVSDLVDDESTVRVNRKGELVSVSEKQAGNAMIGISYLLEEDAKIIRNKIEMLCENSEHKNDFWEIALVEKNRMIITARVVHAANVVEINTYEQLREIDENSNQLKTDAIQEICKALRVSSCEIRDITVLKKGMTNRSFLFSCKGIKYIMRIPGEGTEKLIDRKREAEVYHALAGKKICDDIIYINPENGYKLTVYLENARVCNPFDDNDRRKCMNYLREFHEKDLRVDYEFDIFQQIEFYETLWGKRKSVYSDYEETKKNVYSLKSYIEKNTTKKVLTHIDAVPDNFLFTKNKDGKEEIRLIDWEYAAMQDPHVDIAMFGIYSLYDQKQIDELISNYFVEGYKKETRIKIYCYVSACGLLWSNWCEYKSLLGIEFGEYSLKQYRYAKEYFRIVQEELKG